MEAETQRQASEKEHQRTAAVFAEAKQKVCSVGSITTSIAKLFVFPFAKQYQHLEKDLKSAIQKSRPYFGTVLCI